MRQVLWSLLPVALGGGCPWTSSWQWEGVFHIHKVGTYLWSAAKKDGAYAAASTKIILRTTSTYDASAIESAEPAALTAWSGTFTDVMPGDTLSPNNAYRLVYDADNWVSLFKIQGAAETNLAIFAEHVPTDFENQFHYFHHEEGAETKPSYEVSSVTSCDPAEEPIVKGTIGEVLAASMLITLPTLLGIGCLFSVCKCSSASEHVKTFIHYCNAGASGVLFAVSIFLLMPEASHLMAAGKSEAGLAVAWGSCVIAGWLLGIMMHQASHMLQPAQVAADNTLEEGKEKEPVAKKANWSLAMPVLLGDFIHNFADGIFLGFAFYACDASFAWSMVGATIAHELPQELADFYVLVNKANLRWSTATFLNFLTGLSSVLGAVVAFYLDLGNEAQGACLAIAGGLFLYIACTELGPAVAEHGDKSSRLGPCLQSVLTIGVWLLGAGLLGLVMLDHTHCYVAPAEGEVDPHAGHAH